MRITPLNGRESQLLRVTNGWTVNMEMVVGQPGEWMYLGWGRDVGKDPEKRIDNLTKQG